MQWVQKFEENFDAALSEAQCWLYGVADLAGVPASEAELQRSQPKAGVCPVQWGAQDIVFCCLDCGYDSSCVQCVECFFKANHTGHDVRIHRTTGGTCDCGDPSSWDPQGFCPHHSATPRGLDGPHALELLPSEVRGRAEEVLPALVKQVDALVAAQPDPHAGLRPAARLLAALKRIGEVAFGFRYIVCEQLQAERLSMWIDADLRGEAEDEERDADGEAQAFCAALHDLFLLYVQVSPSFKRRFALAYSEHYSKIAEGESEGVGCLAGLSVQLYTIPEVAWELVTEHSLLDRLSGILAELLETFVEDGTMRFDEQRSLTLPMFSRVHRLMYDLGYAVGHPDVCRYILQTPSVQEALLRPLRLMWRMNPQKRQTQSHILYEELAFREVFPLESVYLQRLGPLGDYCRRPEATLEELRPWYATLARPFASSLFAVTNNTEMASFHLPELRLFIQCMNFEILADAGLGDWSDIISREALVAVLFHAVRTLRFSAEVRHGCWVRNGESMRAQEAEYQRFLQHFDVMAVQVCIVLLARQGSSASPPLEPLAQLWTAAVYDGTPMESEDATWLEKWTALLQEVSDGARATPARQANVRLRVELFWGLLVHALNSLFPVEVAMCSRKWASRFAARCPVLLQRTFVQALAVQPLTLPELSAAVPKELGAREAQVTQALEDIATRRDRKYVLQPRGWRLCDAFLPPPPSSRHSGRDQHGVEEAGLAQREASLLGPRRAEGAALSPRLQDELVASLRFSQLVEVALEFTHHQCFVKLFREASPQASNESSIPGNAVAIQLDNAFAQCLKVLDIVCDVSGPDGGCSAVAAKLCQPPGPELRPGQSVVLQGHSEELDGQFGTLGAKAVEDCRQDVLLAPGSTSSTVKALPEQLKCPPALSTRHDVLLDRLDAFHKAGCDHPLLARLVSPQALPQRLRDRWKALGLRGDEPLAAGAEDSGEARKRLRAQAMRKRQEAVLRRMREQQRAAAVELAGEGGDEEAGDIDGEQNEGENEGEDMGTCSTCREVGTWDANPMAVVAAVGPCNVRKFQGGPSGCSARFTSCGHLIHSRCCSRHAATVTAQARDGTHFFVNPKRGQFPCPMCRSLGNCALPCVAATDLLERVRPDASMEQDEGGSEGNGKSASSSSTAWPSADEAALWEPLRVRVPPAELRNALSAVDRCTSHAMEEANKEQTMPMPQQEEGTAPDVVQRPQTAALVMDAACAELSISSALSPLQLAEHGPPLPLYITLFRSALLFRRLATSSEAVGGAPSAPPPTASSPSRSPADDLQACGVAPPAVWTLDTKAALAEALVGGLCSEAGLSPGAFSSMVGTLLQVRVLQLCHALGGGADFAAIAPEELAKVAQALISFLVYAMWLCAAVWHIPAVERTRLAYLDCADTSALPTLAALLRLPGLSSVDEVIAARRAQAFGQAAACLADVPSPSSVLAGDWSLPWRSPLAPFVELPEMYLEVVRRVRGRLCESCGMVPPEPALCLLCGAVVCMDNKACRGRNRKEGQCTDHARRCGAGQCLFFLPYFGLVLAVSAPICCLWDCPYVDQNGEPNPYLQRPCALQLRLDERRLDSLRQTYSKAAVHREIIQHQEKTRRYIENPL